MLQQLASALRVSTPLMYLRAGLLDSRDGQGVLAAIAADPDLTVPQKQSLTQIYETFRRENARAGESGPQAAQEPAEEPAKRPARKAAGKATPRAGRPRKTSTTPTEE